MIRVFDMILCSQIKNCLFYVLTDCLCHRLLFKHDVKKYLPECDAALSIIFDVFNYLIV